MTKQHVDYEYFSEYDREYSLADYKIFYENLLSYNKALNNLRFEIEKCTEKTKILPDVEMTELRKWIDRHPNLPARSHDNFYSPDNENSLFKLESIVQRDERFEHYDWDLCDPDSRFHYLRKPSFEKDNPDSYKLRLKEALKKYAKNMTTKSQLDSLRKITKTLEMTETGIYYSDLFSSDKEYRKKHLEILGISEDDLWLGHFDLKNTEDIKHCKKLYPLAKEYPDLFRGWYNSDGNIQFDPTYENGLEKIRKEINAKLTEKSKSAKGFKRGIIKVATKIVPEKLGKKTAKIEQKIADVVYRKREKGSK